jgi:hypothetical protein
VASYLSACRRNSPHSHFCTKVIQLHIRKTGEPYGSGLGTVRCIVEHGCAWVLANKRLNRHHDRLAFIIDALLTTACILVIANRVRMF